MLIPVSENGIACGDGNEQSTESLPIERVTGRTRDSDSRERRGKAAPVSISTGLLADSGAVHR
jgi:hypothetical protein